MGNTIIILTLSGLLGVLLYMQWTTVKRLKQTEQVAYYYDDKVPPRFFITGDKHRDFTSVKEFCRAANTRRKDVLIILGDSGFNYYEDIRDDRLKAEIASLNITMFCIHGNKECRPEHIGSYGVRTFCGGKVYYEPKYPNIYFAIDGEIYRIEQERNPKLREILQKDVEFLDQIQVEMATARQFLLTVRFKGKTPGQVFHEANHMENDIFRQGFEVKRMKKADIKRFLAIYFEASMSGEQMPDADGEQYFEGADAYEED